MSAGRPSRRTIVGGGAALGAAISLAVSGLLPPPAQAARSGPTDKRMEDALRRLRMRRDRVLTGTTSRNGWPMEKVVDDRGNIYTRQVPGTPLDGVQMRMGDVEVVLVHLIRRYHYEVEELRVGDVVGWRAPRTVRRTSPQSDQASGTAVRIRPGHHPAGVSGGFFPLQISVIRDVLAELDGVVRWGGDDSTPDEALFAIAVGPDDERLAAVAGRLRGWQDDPARGAGTAVDVLAPARRRAAEALTRRQRRRTS